MKLVCAVKNRNPRGRRPPLQIHREAVASARAPALPRAPRPRAGPVDRGTEGRRAVRDGRACSLHACMLAASLTAGSTPCARADRCRRPRRPCRRSRELQTAGQTTPVAVDVRGGRACCMLAARRAPRAESLPWTASSARPGQRPATCLLAACLQRVHACSACAESLAHARTGAGDRADRAAHCRRSLRGGTPGSAAWNACVSAADSAADFLNAARTAAASAASERGVPAEANRQSPSSDANRESESS